MSTQPQPQEDKLAYSIEEAAVLLSIRRDSVYELIRSNKLGSFKVGSRRLVARQQLEAFIESQVTS